MFEITGTEIIVQKAVLLLIIKQQQETYWRSFEDQTSYVNLNQGRAVKSH